MCSLICVQLMELCALTSACTKMIWKTWPKVRKALLDIKAIEIHLLFFVKSGHCYFKCNLAANIYLNI